MNHTVDEQVTPEQRLATEEAALTAEYIDRLHALAVELDVRVSDIERHRDLSAEAFARTLEALKLRRHVVAAALDVAEGTPEPEYDTGTDEQEAPQSHTQRAPHYGDGLAQKRFG